MTDIAKYKSDDPTAVIQNWMSNRDVIEFLGLWESLHNVNLKPLEFEWVRNQAGANEFTMSPKKWINVTDAIKLNLLPPELTKEQIGFTYVSEADMLNVALFGKTAKQWKDENTITRKITIRKSGSFT